MPIFDYECPKCLIKDEIFVSQSDTEGFTIVCEVCSVDMVKLMSKAGFILKGTGWYKPSAYQGKDSEEHS